MEPKNITTILLLQLENPLNEYHQVEKLDFINNIVQEKENVCCSFT